MLEEVEGTDHVVSYLVVVQPANDGQLAGSEVLNSVVESLHGGPAQAQGGVRHHRLEVALDEDLAALRECKGPFALPAAYRGELAQRRVTAD